MSANFSLNFPSLLLLNKYTVTWVASDLFWNKLSKLSFFLLYCIKFKKKKTVNKCSQTTYLYILFRLIFPYWNVWLFLFKCWNLKKKYLDFWIWSDDCVLIFITIILYISIMCAKNVFKTLVPTTGKKNLKA